VVLLESTSSSVPRVETIGTRTALPQATRDINFRTSASSGTNYDHPPESDLGVALPESGKVFVALPASDVAQQWYQSFGLWFLA